MRKKRNIDEVDEVLPEYDFSKGEQGKYAERYSHASDSSKSRIPSTSITGCSSNRQSSVGRKSGATIISKSHGNHLRGTKMAARKIRSDARVGSIEKSRGLPPGTIRNSSGRDARSDKKIGTIRKQSGKK